MNKSVAFALVASFIAVPAHAQESEGVGGFKLGAVVGYDSVTIEFDGEDGSKGGLNYGVTAGYDFHLGGVILGVEGEFSDSTTKETVTDIDVVGDEASLAAGRDLYVGARLGVPVSKNVLLYAKGGYTNARVKLRYDDGVDTFSAGDNLGGFRIGAGAEYVSGPIFGRVEYRYSDYGDYKYDGFNTGISTKRNQVVLSGGYRF